MATEVIVNINTDGGGDFSTIAAWIATIDNTTRDLVSRDEKYTVNLSGATSDTATVNAGLTFGNQSAFVDATRYIEFRGDCSSIWNNSVYTKETGTITDMPGFTEYRSIQAISTGSPTISQLGHRARGVKIIGCYGDGTNIAANSVFANLGDIAASELIDIHNNIFFKFDRAVEFPFDNIAANIRNNLFYKCSDAVTLEFGSDKNATFENNIIIWRQSGTTREFRPNEMNIVRNNYSNFSQTSLPVGSGNIIEVANSVTTNGYFSGVIDGALITNQIWTPSVGSPFIGSGFDLTGILDLDMDGNPRAINDYTMGPLQYTDPVTNLDINLTSESLSINTFDFQINLIGEIQINLVPLLISIGFNNLGGMIHTTTSDPDNINVTISQAIPLNVVITEPNTDFSSSIDHIKIS